MSFTDNGEAVADCQDVAVDESGNAVCAVTFDDPGSHAIVATFSGNEGFAGSASSTRRPGGERCAAAHADVDLAGAVGEPVGTG